MASVRFFVSPCTAGYEFDAILVFPVFWVVGVVIIFSPLRPTPEWETGRSAEERQKLLAEMRVSELKWARRCLYALVSLLVVVIVLVAAIVSTRV